jgi:hypothetical protein
MPKKMKKRPTYFSLKGVAVKPGAYKYLDNLLCSLNFWGSGHVEVYFGHIHKYILEMMHTDWKSEMPAVFSPPHLYV